MEKEKIRKVYQNFGIKISDESIEEILKDKERTAMFLEIYEQEEKKVGVLNVYN